MSVGLELRDAEPGDRQYVETLLAGNDLPTADLDGKLDCLYVCESGGEQVGVGGLERYGDVALLRSVAVEASARGDGYGTELCRELLERARASGVDEVYLLTTTAEGFFERLGFEPTDRAAVPDPIRGTSEFSDLCPSTAVAMRRGLDSPDGNGAAGA